MNRLPWLVCLAATLLFLGGCAALEVGKDNPLSVPPPMDEKRHGGGEPRPVMASEVAVNRYIDLYEEAKREEEKYILAREALAVTARPPQAPALYAGFPSGVPVFPAVVLRSPSAQGVAITADLLREELLRHRLFTFQGLGGIEMKVGSREFGKNSCFTLNAFGKSQHFFSSSNPQNEDNFGAGFRIKGGCSDFVKNERWFIDMNVIENTTGGPTTMFCPGTEIPVLELGGYTASIGGSFCVGTYYNKYRHKTIPLAGFFPGISVKSKSGVSINVAVLLENPFVPLGRATGVIGFANGTPEELYQRPSGSSNPLSPIGGAVAVFYRPFYADWTTAK